MKVILLIVLLAFTTSASAQSFDLFVSAATTQLRGILDLTEDIIHCVTSLFTTIVSQLVDLVKDLLTFNLVDFVGEILNLVPNVLQAVQAACKPILNDILSIISKLLMLIAQLLQGQNSSIGKFIGVMLEMSASELVDKPVIPVDHHLPNNGTRFKNETISVISGNTTLPHDDAKYLPDQIVAIGTEEATLQCEEDSLYCY